MITLNRIINYYIFIGYLVIDYNIKMRRRGQRQLSDHIILS